LVSVEVRYLVLADQVTVVTDGRGSMPGFGGRYDPEELEAVVRYTREVL
jgi:mono/diheme cytochrome c family protein